MINLGNRVSLVTGATGAIGRSIVKSLHKHGSYIIATGTNDASLAEISESLKDRGTCIKCNLSDSQEVNSLISKIEMDLGFSIDILVNNAGITSDSLSMRMSDESWENVMKVNLEAPFKLIRSCLKNMLKNRWGRIINISSLVGVSGNPGQANYCASKAGIIGMSKSISAEVASRNITVNCVAPGLIESNMSEKIPDNIKHEMIKSIPLGRSGTPDDVSNAVLFLAGDMSSYITGQTIHVNGGMIMI